ncbi:hypothetical protein TraAM80_03420 [Trypanosoma rangeli]|uniref:Uncharacterized protein n=1 Tax=Trypanosoma rangeli TaxID=5698 RepID=A0A3R7MSL6_TRYRA|nr:uncharacterized protein TraAM80_03420 [Trypanosoma rangeli]RNF07444.1 hypothetical protein TraAM80_03420 [Trypanosoma rangeli]|eukprot:RNF07444.1 hypothetical protein TraAM80_03420 [Trypanosoma rangeli]
MGFELVVDVACEGLYEAITRTLSIIRLGSRCLQVRESQNMISNSVLVINDDIISLLLLFITFNDFMLMLRHNCVRNYLQAIYDASKCPVYVIMLGQLTCPRQSRFWEEVSRLCADDSFLTILVGFDCAPSFEQAADIVVAHGLKASKQQSEADPLVRVDGRRKCDPTDFHALYLDMLLEISSVSERRASVIAGAFPSISHLLETIDSGVHHRVQVEEYYETRATSVLDPYISEVLSTDYSTVEAQEIMNAMLEESQNFFL